MKGYQVLATSWYYNDEIYVQEDGAHPFKVYKTEEAANKAARDLTITEAREVSLGHFCNWDFDELENVNDVLVKYGKELLDKGCDLDVTEDMSDEMILEILDAMEISFYYVQSVEVEE